ncbi:MAG TPA: hypothetical protein PLE92_08730 [Lentisphaeria bacterium]|nr:hypothetical protein [Lentisphaerota bacterium]OQC14868.1 MAG: hypothetical protein BWX73_01612 [Lentisphaerae bacterium ADurb.Bin082]HPY90180.1 hypothetical protein [Lentisphaeria bacterium]HQC53201.1 hypothetical protein [Lentisphaeria bacterium]HQL87798.1 hypothetical protein [Lentisphaeria bacterium]
MIAQITLQDGTLLFIIGLFSLCLLAYLYTAVRERTLAWRLSAHSLFFCKQCGLVISARPLQAQPRQCPRCAGRPVPYRSAAASNSNR